LWLRELAGDEDETFLADGIIYGFHLAPVSASFTAVNMDNYKSATNPSTKAKVEQTIREEILQDIYVIVASKQL